MNVEKIVVGAVVPIAGVTVAFWHELLSLQARALFILLITAPIGAMMVLLFPEAFFVRHRADETGLTLGSPFHRPFRFSWHEIVTVDYNATASWLRPGSAISKRFLGVISEGISCVYTV